MAEPASTPTSDVRLDDLLRAAKAGEPVRARGSTLTGSDIEALLSAARRPDGTPALLGASFSGVQFVGPVQFIDVVFAGGVDFSAATFDGSVRFSGAKFEGYASFWSATFNGAAQFDRATFSGQADFQDTTWTGIADFVSTTFNADALFQGPTVFRAEARFDGARFKGNLLSCKAFEADVWFAEAQFEDLPTLGPLRVDGNAVLDGAVFQRRVTIPIRAQALSAEGTEFRSGADLYVQSAVICLDGAGFGAPSTLSSATRDSTYGALLADSDTYERQSIPHVASLRGAAVAELSLYGVDLRSCRFHGAHGLDRLRMEQVILSEPPTGWQKSAWGLPMRWTRRLTIAEEQRWRAGAHDGQRDDLTDVWGGPATRVRPSTPNWRESAPPTPHEIAAVYRSLRKAREESRDEPGAADFYYGEMEMRRASRSTREAGRTRESATATASVALPMTARGDHDSTRPSPAGERAVLFLYWLVSGYGMRASRSLAALGITLLVAAVLLDAVGFVRDQSSGRSLLFALESSVSLLKAPDLKVTAAGELITVVLRLLGPLFFGLALLSLRGRVKR